MANMVNFMLWASSGAWAFLLTAGLPLQSLEPQPLPASVCSPEAARGCWGQGTV